MNSASFLRVANHFLGLLIPPLLLVGCIKEDLSQCYKDIVVRYEFIVGTQDGSNVTEEQFNSDVKNLSVFVFDEYGLYKGVWFFDMKEVENSKKLPIPLGTGTYSFVMWGGITPEQYEVGTKGSGGSLQPLEVGKTKVEELQLQVKGKNNSSVIDEQYFNLYHSSSLNIAVKEKVNTVVPLPVKKISNDIEVRLFGFPDQAQQTYSAYDDIEVLVMANNGRYNYDNTPDNSSAKMFYKPFWREAKDNELIVVLRTMDIFRVTEPILLIRKKSVGVDMYAYDLKKMIRQIEEPDKQEKYIIEIFYNTHGAISIKINGWVVIPVIVEV